MLTSSDTECRTDPEHSGAINLTRASSQLLHRSTSLSSCDDARFPERLKSNTNLSLFCDLSHPCLAGNENNRPIHICTQRQTSYELQAGGYAPCTPISRRPLARPPGGPICLIFPYIYIIYIYIYIIYFPICFRCFLIFPHILIHISYMSLYYPTYFLYFPEMLLYIYIYIYIPIFFPITSS